MENTNKERQMKSRGLQFPVLMLLLVICVALNPQRAEAQQPPALDEPWNELQQPSGSTGLNFDARLGVVGPSGSGMGFYTHFEDTNGSHVTSIKESKLPVYIIVETPPGSVQSIASCIVYHPPAHQIRQWLFQGQNLGSGTQRLGPYGTSPGDPFGSYAFRIGLQSRDSSGAWNWAEQVAYIDFQQDNYVIPGGGSTTGNGSNSDSSTAAGGDTNNTDSNSTGTGSTTETNSGSRKKYGDADWASVVMAGLLVVASIVIGVLLARRQPAQVQSAPYVPPYRPTERPASYGPSTSRGTVSRTATAPRSQTTIYNPRQSGGTVSQTPPVLRYRTTAYRQQTPTTGITGARSKLILPDDSEIPIGADSAWIGRDELAGIISPSDSVYISRQHINITYQDRQYYIEDSLSSNGTKLNAAEIKGMGKFPLRDGDTIQLANVVYLQFVTLEQIKI